MNGYHTMARGRPDGFDRLAIQNHAWSIWRQQSLGAGQKGARKAESRDPVLGMANSEQSKELDKFKPLLAWLYLFTREKGEAEALKKISHHRTEGIPCVTTKGSP